MVIRLAEPTLGDAEANAVTRVIASGWVTEGPECDRFAAELNQFLDVPHGVFAPNGTLALVLALQAIGIGPGDQVLVPDTTFIGSANAVLMAGGTPVFVDVDPDTFQLDLARAEPVVTPRTRAVMPVHLYGSACDMTAVAAFAARHGLRVVEDAAQAIGVYHAGRHVGGFGDVGCFSFFGDKSLTTGEGGYVVCRDPAVYDRLRLIRGQGRLDRGRYVHEVVGCNFRLTDLQAAVGRVQLARLPETLAAKAAVWQQYRRLLADLPGVRLLGTPAEGGRPFVPFRTVLMAADVSALADHLAGRGVETRTFFYPLHRQPCFGGDWPGRTDTPASWSDADYPNAMFGYAHGICLPTSPSLTPEQVQYVADGIRGFYAGRRPRPLAAAG